MTSRCGSPLASTIAEAAQFQDWQPSASHMKPVEKQGQGSSATAVAAETVSRRARNRILTCLDIASLLSRACAVPVGIGQDACTDELIDRVVAHEEDARGAVAFVPPEDVGDT